MSKTAADLYLRTNEIEEFVGALEFSVEVIASLERDVSRWKWLIIALHNALQGACVCALSGADTAGISYLSKDSGKKMWDWLDVTSREKPTEPQPYEWLAELLVLYERVKNPLYLGDPLTSNPEMDDDVKLLNALRNKFIHFTPQAWSLEISGMPRIIGNVSRAIQHLAVEHPTFSHRFRSNEMSRIQQSLSSLRSLTSDS